MFMSVFFISCSTFGTNTVMGHQLDELRAETRSLAGESVDSEEGYWEGPGTSEINRSPSDRTGFLFGHNLRPRPSGLHEFRPLPSQVQFLFQAFVDNINCLIQIVHAPTVAKLIRGTMGSNPEPLSLPNEALMFSIYYAAITSMEEEDVCSLTPPIPLSPHPGSIPAFYLPIAVTDKKLDYKSNRSRRTLV